MGAFAVFGISKCTIRDQVMKTFGRKKDQSFHDYYKALEEVVDKKFEAKRARVRLSPEFDAPQFCVEFINHASKADGFRDLAIYARQPKKDKAGNLVKNKKGHQVISWQPYEVAF